MSEPLPQPKRLIEVAFPLREVSQASLAELHPSRRPHIRFLHWWRARRPLAACRAAIFEALVADPDDEHCPPAFRTLVEELVPSDYDSYDREGPHPALRRRLLGFVADLCKWENSNNQRLLEIARRLVLEANGGTPPRVLDPFAGGGSIPLEALRLGCEAHASELNPVAVLILKCTVEYPQKYGRPDSRPVPDYIHEMDRRDADAKGQQRLTDGDGSWAAAYRRSPLATDVRYWGQWMLERAREELAPYYPPDPDGRVPMAYLWTRTVKCANPACGADMPLMRQYWLARKHRKKVALKPDVDQTSKSVRFIVVEGEATDDTFGKRTVERGNTTCLVCNGLTSARHVRGEADEGRMNSKMTSVVLDTKGGKTYRPADPNDREVFEGAVEEMQAKASSFDGDYPLVPDEPARGTFASNAQGGMYGFYTFGRYFNDRQALALTTLVRLAREARAKMLDRGLDPERAKAVGTYLGLAADRLADYNCTLARWGNDDEGITNAYSRQGLAMVWDFAEANPLGSRAGSFGWSLTLTQESIVAAAQTGNASARVKDSDAMTLPQDSSSMSSFRNM